MKRTDIVLRSMMFVPGHNEKLLDSASKSNADALIFDMEDSVLPNKNKINARNLTVKKIKEGLFKKFHIFPRINDRESGFLLQDLQALTIDEVDGFVYPKSQRGSDIYFIDKLLETIEYEKGYPIGKFKIVPLIETASAVYNAQEICLASERVIAITFGCEDFVADLEGIHDQAGNSLFVPRALIALAARATGVLPIDTVHIHVHDLEDLRRNVSLARSLGFEGQLILHPKEIEIVHECYTPSKKEVEDAEEMIILFYEAQANNKGVAVKDNKFIGPPMMVAAKNILERDKRIRK
jgi:citrate lyase subunit beta/citryl-CoA lyase